MIISLIGYAARAIGQSERRALHIWLRRAIGRTARYLSNTPPIIANDAAKKTRASVRLTAPPLAAPRCRCASVGAGLDRVVPGRGEGGIALALVIDGLAADAGQLSGAGDREALAESGQESLAWLYGRLMRGDRRFLCHDECPA